MPLFDTLCSLSRHGSISRVFGKTDALNSASVVLAEQVRINVGIGAMGGAGGGAMVGSPAPSPLQSLSPPQSPQPAGASPPADSDIPWYAVGGNDGPAQPSQQPSQQPSPAPTPATSSSSDSNNNNSSGADADGNNNSSNSGDGDGGGDGSTDNGGDGGGDGDASSNDSNNNNSGDGDDGNNNNNNSNNDSGNGGNDDDQPTDPADRDEQARKQSLDNQSRSVQQRLLAQQQQQMKWNAAWDQTAIPSYGGGIAVMPSAQSFYTPPIAPTPFTSLMSNALADMDAADGESFAATSASNAGYSSAHAFVSPFAENIGRQFI